MTKLMGKKLTDSTSDHSVGSLYLVLRLQVLASMDQADNANYSHSLRKICLQIIGCWSLVQSRLWIITPIGKSLDSQYLGADVADIGSRLNVHVDKDGIVKEVKMG